ncbi:MAG TPA: hypothetical protein VH352_00130 [Pseudonocardiaceae bacterium]|nr:hypothetical protein [Pseudonocardiaceae bacterium]
MATADTVHELNDLRRGRGMNAANLGSRVGPRLRAACGVANTDSPAQIRRRVAARLTALCERLPADLRLAATVALALHDEATGEFLDRRIGWLAEHFDRDPRTARRRVDTAFRLLGERIDDEGAPVHDDDAPDGWYVESLKAVLRMDLEPAQLVEERRIVSTVDELSAIAVSLHAPRGVSGEPGGLIAATMTYGGEIVAAQQVDGGHTRFHIRLSETIGIGQRHDYGIQFTSYPRSWAPYDLLAPLDRCEHFAVRVRFGGDTQPDLVWQLRRQGMGYGLQWSA